MLQVHYQPWDGMFTSGVAFTPFNCLMMNPHRKQENFHTHYLLCTVNSLGEVCLQSCFSNCCSPVFTSLFFPLFYITMTWCMRETTYLKLLFCLIFKKHLVHLEHYSALLSASPFYYECLWHNQVNERVTGLCRIFKKSILIHFNLKFLVQNPMIIFIAFWKEFLKVF